MESTTIAAAQAHYLKGLQEGVEVVQFPHGPAAVQLATLSFGRDQQVEIGNSHRLSTFLRCPAAKEPGGSIIGTTGVFIVVREPAP
ncbi:MAG: hypothetical protein KIT72_05455 [Polyangiaceae bacterium]|nr:hypothetical protein [Polyangiaceae bacterium]MCW5789845.1 hypothetical protein [Polyangiaceae bacterium]